LAFSFWLPPSQVVRAASPGQANGKAANSSAATVENYCLDCHSNEAHRGGLSLESFDLDHPWKDSATAERIIRKLRAGMMPPPGVRRPSPAELDALVESIEKRVDAVALAHPYASCTPLHRLNRLEYANSIKALLDLDVDVESLLPPDDLSHGFNNMADVLTVSPSLLEAYISAASKISREAVGDQRAASLTDTYLIPRVVSQTRHMDRTPFGTRGGVALEHIFPADGDYVFKVAFYTHQMGYLFGQTQAKGQQLEIAINGERVTLIDVNSKFKDTDDVRTSLFIYEPVRRSFPLLLSKSLTDQFRMK